MTRSPPSRPPRHPRYEIVRRLGSGGAGSVYFARDLLDDSREVALKVCHLQVAPGDLLREFRILRELRHPGIARAFDFGLLPEGGSAYFTMEYFSGPDLEKESPRLRRQARSGSSGPLLGIFIEIAAALAYLHRKGLLHLDLKPSNVVLEGGRARLIDFGLFQNVQAQQDRMPRGTAYFTAPEVFEGGVVDRRTDLYALGAALYRSFTGRYPIPGRTLAEVAHNHRHLSPRAPSGLPEELSRIILKLLAKSPENRFQGAEEVQRALGEIDPGATQRAASAFLFEDLDFAGRRRELDAFFTWFGELSRCKGSRVLLLEGEPGAGKSRLAEACTTEMLGLGAQIIPLRSFGGGDRGGLRRLIEKLLALHPLSREERGRFRFLLAGLGIAADSRSRKELADLDLEQIRARVFREGLQLLEARAAPPLIIVLEDIHRADPQLLDFLRRLGERREPESGQAPVGILATSRPAPGIEDRTAAVAGAGARAVRLGRMRRRELLEALRHTDPALPRREAERLAALSRGNPGLLVQHLRRAHAGEDALAAAPDAELADLLAERLRALDGDARALILHLALLERPAEEPFLRSAAGLGPAAFLRARQRLERAGFLRGSRNGIYLDQSPAAETAERIFGAAAIRSAHVRIGRRLLRDPRRLSEAARHLLRGGRSEEGVRAAERAGDGLRREGRVEEALALYIEALEHAAAPILRRKFLEEIGGLEERSGQFDEAGKRYREILAGGGLPARDRLRILRKVAGVQQRRGEDEAARDTFEEALQLLEEVDDVEEQLHLFNELSALHLLRRDMPRATTFTNRGLELLASGAASGLNREARAVHALNFRLSAGHILLRQFEYERATEEFLEGLRHAEALGSLASTALLLNNLGIAYHQTNRLRESLHVYRRATAIAREMGDDTALFSIQCNVAGIRARLGELRSAWEILHQVEGMPHSRRSKRARLFLLHCSGLVERLELKDSRQLWEECIRLADEIPDPLFASYGRVYLLENEIQHGRWASARAVMDSVEEAHGEDPRLDQAVAVRRAWLEALCGRRDAARALLAQPRLRPSRPHYPDLWDDVFTSAALIELGDLAAAESLLEKTRKSFERSRQYPGSLECLLLLAEAGLRAREPERAARRLDEARRTLALHDSSGGSRGAAVRMPWLEARAGLQSRRASAGTISDRLVGAAGNIGPGSTAEVVWLLDLTAAEHGVPGAHQKAAASRRRFAEELAPGDRESYLARDHRARLGLAPPESRSEEAPAPEDGGLRRRYEALVRLRDLRQPGEALGAVLRAARAQRGAIFLESDARPAASQGFGKRAGKALEKIRAAALRAAADREKPDRAAADRAGADEEPSWLCAEIQSPGRPRLGVLYVEPGPGSDPGLPLFLDLAARLLAGVLLPGPAAGWIGSTTPRVVRETVKTQTLSSTTFLTSESRAMREVINLIHRSRKSQLPILLTGESGTGKDHLARWIHSISPRGKGPFVALDCSAVPEALLEAEVFGHEAGAFTGAERARTGYLFAASGGSFYIDNIDSLSVDFQAKLLRVIEERAARPLGGRSARPADVRFIASSQRDLKELCARGEFRKDLYFRLAGITLDLPPLRERAEDIPLLVRHFQRQIPGKVPVFTPEAMETLKAHSWPGNVRELESLVRRLALTCEGAADGERVARALGLQETLPAFPRWIFEGRGYDELIDDLKREYLLYLFEKFGGDLARIASELGTTKRNVYLRFSQAGIRPVDLRSYRRSSR